MDQELKLKRFQSAVFSEIETRTARAKDESKEEFDAMLKESTDRQLQISYDYIQHETAELKKHTKRELAKLGLENKRKLLTNRNELVDSMFVAVEARVKKFVKTQEYQDYFLDEIESFSKKYKLTDVEIHVGYLDINNKNYIQKAYKLPCNIILDKSILLGGFAVKDTAESIYYDYTLHNKLKEARDNFSTNEAFAL